MIFPVLIVFMLGVATGTVVDNQYEGKVGNYIVSHGAPDTNPNTTDAK